MPDSWKLLFFQRAAEQRRFVLGLEGLLPFDEPVGDLVIDVFADEPTPSVFDTYGAGYQILQGIKVHEFYELEWYE